MDHQPYHLEEAEQAGVDFQLSGHTHYGQVWPVSWIEDRIYEDAFGKYTINELALFRYAGRRHLKSDIRKFIEDETNIELRSEK